MVYNCSTRYRHKRHLRIARLNNEINQDNKPVPPANTCLYLCRLFEHNVLIMYAKFGMFISFPSIAVLIKLFPSFFAHAYAHSTMSHHPLTTHPREITICEEILMYNDVSIQSIKF